MPRDTLASDESISCFQCATMMTVSATTYPTPDDAAVVHVAERLMEETMARYDPSHDAYHGMPSVQKSHRATLSISRSVRRVRKTALSLARAVQSPSTSPDFLTIELAALLHDVLDKKYVPESAASDPYAYFLPFFQSLRALAPSIDLIADGRAKTIAKIVENVSWTTEKKLRNDGKWGEWHEQCIELHCTQDADRLDAIGAFGATASCLLICYIA